ncbi:DUF222 domain-containing protein [Nocardioides sp.]|uniref:DUF222 domain-containing protein n=1 Tax=Nocardioides sp. TaxID=35761 RepID=UPI002ED52D5E
MEPDLGLADHEDFTYLDASATLAAVEDSLVVRRRAEARDLALAAHWADLHATDPQQGPGVRRREWRGEDRLIDLGGEGTPPVQELCLAELATSRRVHPHSARRVVADALDLRHRLPSWWRAVHDLRLEAWIARKAAALSRSLDYHAVAVVDAALPEGLAEVSPARLLEVVRAKVIAADPAAHQAKLDEEKRRRYVSLSQTDEFGLRHVIARVRAGDAAWIDAMVDRVADLLAPTFPAGTTKDELRSEAFGWLARPAELLQLLLDGVPDPDFEQADLAAAFRGLDPARLRPQVVLYLHLHQAAINGKGCVECGIAAVARVEDIGPLLASEVPEWLGHTNVTVKPVIDLADQHAVDAYEHPDSVAERIHLRCPADCFPYGNQVTRDLDLDHVEPFVPGTPGQTGDHNSQPLSRTAHRAKTFAGYTVRQLRPGEYVWRTPNGRYTRVNHHGTTALTEQVGSGLLSDDPLDQAIAQMTLDLQATGRARVPRDLVSS